VVPAKRRARDPDPIVVLAGGPGQGAIALATQVVPLFARLGETRDLVLVDQRGTGGSNPLALQGDEGQGMQSVFGGAMPEKLGAFLRASTRMTHADPKAEYGAFAAAWAARTSAASRGGPLPNARHFVEDLRRCLKLDAHSAALFESPFCLVAPSAPSAKAPCAVVTTPAASVTWRSIGIDGLKMRTRKPRAISVNMPYMMPFGMSRFGSVDSSAASGSCSMARNSHTAKGMAAKGGAT